MEFKYGVSVGIFNQLLFGLPGYSVDELPVFHVEVNVLFLEFFDVFFYKVGSDGVIFEQLFQVIQFGILLIELTVPGLLHFMGKSVAVGE